MKFRPTYSPVVPEPTREQILAFAEAKGMEPAEAAATLFNAREDAIARMEQDPLRFGYVPPVWRVGWALLGVPWLDETFAAGMRKALGFWQAVRTLLVLGGNRSSKTQFELFTVLSLLFRTPKSTGWFFHMTHQQSVEYHQRNAYYMLPHELRTQKAIRGRTAYISWTQQMGFSNNKFVLPEQQECSFRNYCQDRNDAIEGGELNVAAADELIPMDWVETLELRLATRGGFMIVAQTPVDGYSQLVRAFCEGAETVRWTDAFLLPRDGGAPREDLALGLTPEEFGELMTARANKKPFKSPMSRPQDCDAWLRGESGAPAVPGERKFEQMPRVMRCRDGKRAVLFFTSADNPFGNAPEVVDICRPKGSTFTRTRFYGFAERTVDVKFPLFGKAHIIAASAVSKAGTNYLIVDPCSGRNFFMLWIRATPQGAFVYREWPGSYHIPGIGVPEVWAEPSTDVKWLDGRRAGGQKSFGWGLAQYKAEIARLEGWKAYKDWMGQPQEQGPKERRFEEIVAGWDEHGPADEVIEARYMDARFANVKSFEDGGMVTLLDKFDEIGLTFFDTSQNSGRWTIDDGVQMINDALWYDQERPADINNQPHLFISEECRNLIFAMETWTNSDGGESATKDPVDCLRYFFLKGCAFIDREAMDREYAQAGGCY